MVRKESPGVDRWIIQHRITLNFGRLKKTFIWVEIKLADENGALNALLSNSC